MGLSYQIIEVAKTYSKTPWHHKGRLKGIGIDCCGLIICSCNECGLYIAEPENYGLGDEIEILVSTVSKYADLLPENDEMQLADIIIFRSRLMYNHCGLYSGNNNFIHADQGTGRVSETELDSKWRRRMHSTHRLRGLA